MTAKSIAVPDIKLLLDMDGIIREASMSDIFAGEQANQWLGRPWVETVRPGDGVHLRRMVEDARETGVSSFRQVVQLLPSGTEAPIEYATIRLDGEPSLLAVGKSLRAVTELQNRLIEAQQTMERDYWKLREIETRYRTLFNACMEAILLLDAQTLNVLEWNPVAARAIGLPERKPRSGGSTKFVEILSGEDRDNLMRMLQQLRERGKAPPMHLKIGKEGQMWLAHASLIASAESELLLIQFLPPGQSPITSEAEAAIPTDGLLQRGPDAFVVIDPQGAILRANRAFLDLIQLSSETLVLGQPLGQWLGRPGADMTVLLANVLRLGAVRLFSTTLHGDQGSEVEVEISASGNTTANPSHIGVFIRDISRRLHVTETRTSSMDQLLDSLTKQVGKTSLRKLVDETVEVVERHYMEEALELAGGNRTVAAELLGLSRQSLYVKLNRYGLESEDKGEARRTLTPGKNLAG